MHTIPLLLSVIVTLALALKVEKGSQPIDSIVTSPNDNREYKLITLPNKLQAMIISDPDADKSAASLDVKVG